MLSARQSSVGGKCQARGCRLLLRCAPLSPVAEGPFGMTAFRNGKALTGDQENVSPVPGVLRYGRFLGELYMDTINKLRDILTAAAAKYFTEPRGRWIFRGHSKSNYSLIPSVGRAKHTAKSRERYERSLF